MQRLALSLAFAGLLTTVAFAANCVPGTLAGYVALGPAGCFLGGLEVGDFQYTAAASGGAPEIAADQINVTPLLAPVGLAGLEFAAPWKVNSGQKQGSKITYRVLSPTAGLAVQRLALASSGFQAGPIGGVFVNETAGDQVATYNLKLFLECAQACRTRTSASQMIAPTAELAVSDDVVVNSILGTASMTDFIAWLGICPACV